MRLCDEAALLACAAYVDLNPIRAGIAPTLEQSHFTSAQRRIEAQRAAAADAATPGASNASGPDRFLAPLEINQQQDAPGAVPSATPHRASDKGFLPISFTQYLGLLDWTARQVVHGQRGATPQDAPGVLEQMGISVQDWSTLVRDFGRLFYLVAGRPTTLATQRSRLSQRPFHVPRAAQQILATSA